MGRSKKLPKILEKEERQKLLNVFNERYPTGQRNKAIVDFLLNTGLRLSELVNLKWQHLDLMTGKLEIIEGKGAKDRNLRVKERVLKVMRNWKDRQVEEMMKRGINEPATYVFTTLTGKQLKPANIRRMIYKYADKAGIQRYEVKTDKSGEEYKERKVNPHSLRHTFATKLLRDTSNIRTVQRALGHADISTTMIYTFVADEELENDLINLRD